MRWRRRNDGQDTLAKNAVGKETPAGALAAGGRAIAINGPVLGSAVSGDNVRVIHLHPEVLQPPAEVLAPPGIDNLPARPRGFVGRRNELDMLTATLTAPGPVVVAAVNGLGGMGKSTLVAHWAGTHPHGCAPIVWVTAESEAEISRGLVELAIRLQPSLAQVLDEGDLSERAMQWLASHTGWLLILDNAEDLTLVTTLLARVGTGGRVVITSRRSSGWQTGITIMPLDILTASESLRLLTELCTVRGPRDLKGAAELCAELGHLPLAIEQAGAYLAQDMFLTPRDYLHLLAEYPDQMFGQGSLDTPAERTLARIWQVSLDRILASEPAAVDLLRTLAWYGPDDIPLALCQHADLDSVIRSKALSLLTAYSLITPNPTTGAVSIHRLVQAVTRTPDPTDKHRRPNDIARAHTRAANTILACLPDHDEPANWPTWRTLLAHIDHLTNNTRTCDDLTTLTIARIRTASGTFLYGQGAAHEAQVHLHRASTDRERILGPDHPDTLNARHNLAGAYRAAGRIDEAIALYERTLTDTERTVGPDHPHALFTRNNLAVAYQDAGRIDHAITLFEHTHADTERILGPEHPDTLISGHNLANAYLIAGRVGEAITLFERTHADTERILGHAYSHALITRNNLAGAYRAAGRVSEAIALFEHTLTDIERTVGPDHPQALTTRNNLAVAYQDAGRADEAITLFEHTHADTERILGPEHPQTLTISHNLANAYLITGQVNEAITLFEHTLTDIERILGPDHPHTLDTRSLLTSAYRRRKSEAAVLDQDHPG